MAPEERALFADAVEGLFVRALGSRLTPSARARLKSAGLDVANIQARYPIAKFREFVEIARQEAFPGVSVADAHRQMGELTVTGYGETLMGRALLSLLKLLGVQRSLKRLDANLRAVNNFSQTRFTPISDGVIEYWINELAISPDYTRGLVNAGMRASGAETVSVEPVPDRGEGYTFRITWTERRRT